MSELSIMEFGLFDPAKSDERLATYSSLDYPSVDANFANVGETGHNSKNGLNKSHCEIPPNSDILSNSISLVNGQKVGTVRIRTRVSSGHSKGDFSSLPPEPQLGNVEYKL